MRKLLASVLSLGLVATLFFAVNRQGRTEAAAEKTMLAHNVFFTLKDNSAASKKKLMDGCKKYLAKHPGTVFFAAGTLAEDLKRPVNDRDFDVSLHLVFKDRAAHDQYQEAPLHKQFVEECKDLWKSARVFDSVVEQ